MSGCEHGTKCCDACRSKRMTAGQQAYYERRRLGDPLKPVYEFRGKRERGVPRSSVLWGWGW